MAKKIICSALTLVLLLSVLTLPAAAGGGRSDNCRIVRVGYFDFPGFHNQTESGERDGYGYEYLQELKKYVNWKYEYVYASYDECLDLLAEGKIDLLTSVSYSEERDELYDFSELPMGTKSSVLSVKSTNDSCIAGEYRGFNGLRVGMLSGNTANAKLRDFSRAHSFYYTADDSFTTPEELWNALQLGSVDAILTSNLRKIDSERVIAEFAPSPYYAVVREGDDDLLYELNVAMEKINLVTPAYQPLLQQKYYGSDKAGSLVFSAQELDCIRENPELTILIPPSMRPMAYFENGEVCGIEPDLIRKALLPSGLNLKFVLCSSGEEYELARQDTAAYPVIGLVSDNVYAAEVNNQRLTAPYLTINYNAVTRIGRQYETPIIAAVRHEPLTLNYVEKHYPPSQIKYFDNNTECIDALLRGEATHVIMNAYIAEYLVEHDLKSRLICNTVMDHHAKFAIGVDSGADYRLFSVINKCVNALSPDDVRAVLIENTAHRNRTPSFIEYIYLYPAQAVAVALVFFSLILLAVALATRQKRLGKEQAALRETAQFAKIATEAIGGITELNLHDNRVTTYSFVDKLLVKNVSPLSPAKLAEDARAELINPEHLAEYDAMFSEKSLEEVAGSELQKTCTLRVKDASGEYYWALFTLQGIPEDSEHPRNLMIFQKNVEELKREEELRRQQLTDALNTAMAASAAKGVFMSRMSHEIRTPLNAVIGYMTIAKNNTDSIDKVNDCIVKSEIAGKHLLAIINDVLDMSSIESGKLKIAQESFNFKELISDVSTVFYMQAQEKNVTLEVVTHGVSEDFLIGDKLRINQILMNLLSNAVKFTPGGGRVLFTVEQTAIRENRVFMKFTVADNGIGMTSEFLERLFTPFEQQDASIAQTHGGTGLGLSITKNLITMMNGVIEVQSRAGEGAAFVVELPFLRDTVSARSNNAARDFSDVNALIVDDERSACEYMRILLRRCGAESEFAMSDSSALYMLSDAYRSERPFNLCLLDWKMPDADGLNTVRQIRECVGPDMPLIVVSAYDFSDMEVEARAAGVDRFISKPLFQSTMFDLLVDTCGKQCNIPAAGGETPSFVGKRLLLAEDNDMNREIAVDILAQYGFTVDSAENGRETLDIFEAAAPGTYSAVLMDIQMPVMNGYDATKAIRASSHPEAQSIPVIAMTANAFAEDIAASHAAGMNDHISKPIDVAQLLAVLKKHID
ncbi:MAG: response regulator [Oscillospiraceae bacterium]